MCSLRILSLLILIKSLCASPIAFHKKRRSGQSLTALQCLSVSVQKPDTNASQKSNDLSFYKISKPAFLKNATNFDEKTSKNQTSLTEEDLVEGLDIDIHGSLGQNTTWPIDNDLFQGNLCILIRDHPLCTYDFDNEPDVYFEFQFQGKFKRKPSGPLYMALELPQTTEYKLSWPLRVCINAAVAFIKSWGYDFLHVSYGGGKGGTTPHISSPAFQAFDRMVITPETSRPPPLGKPIPESYEDTIRRKEMKFDHSIDTSCTYTMSFNHTYVNIAEWKVYGVPAVKCIDLSFTNALRLVVYEVDDDYDHSSNGNVQTIARGRNHSKRSTATWIQFSNSKLGNKR